MVTYLQSQLQKGYFNYVHMYVVMYVHKLQGKY